MSHPRPASTERNPRTSVLYLMCDDLAEMVRTLQARDVPCGELAEERWGIRTTITLPSGGRLGLYQPTHPTAIAM